MDLYNYGLCPEPPAQKIYWLGGVIEGTAPLDISWGESKNNNGAGITLNAIGHVLDGIRMHNLHDPYVPLAGNDFTLTNSWITHSRDDAIENDAFAAGLIEDNYIEGFHFFYSCTNTGGLRNGWTPNAHAPGGGAGTTVRIENNLIAFKALNSYKGTPWGGLWKDWDRDPSAPTGTRSPDIDFVNNVIYIPAGPTGRCGLAPSHRGVIEGNIVVDMAGCADETDGFRILRGEQGQAFWDERVTQWLEGHPKVARIASDPDYAAWRARPSTEP